MSGARPRAWKRITATDQTGGGGLRGKERKVQSAAAAAGSPAARSAAPARPRAPPSHGGDHPRAHPRRRLVPTDTRNPEPTRPDSARAPARAPTRALSSSGLGSATVFRRKMRQHSECIQSIFSVWCSRNELVVGIARVLSWKWTKATGLGFWVVSSSPGKPRLALSETAAGEELLVRRPGRRLQYQRGHRAETVGPTGRRRTKMRK
ncbi:hypothetical protein CBR_g4831 [Chara braunii]|uniref:Uncharacterized protein n=1 Tax=Chara braunii TaxID=69332 RepID=A0A388KIX5_CHABU|nr:hypothetical protein CBR_g4831 [Chara braunii]|eukprot:GBG70004.1 hypothetical protein CBR_g4831 [Chara braunii]